LKGISLFLSKYIKIKFKGLVSLSHAKEVIGTHSDDRILTHPEKAIERAEQIIVVHVREKILF